MLGRAKRAKAARAAWGAETASHGRRKVDGCRWQHKLAWRMFWRQMQTHQDGARVEVRSIISCARSLLLRCETIIFSLLSYFRLYTRYSTAIVFLLQYNDPLHFPRLSESRYHMGCSIWMIFFQIRTERTRSSGMLPARSSSRGAATFRPSAKNYMRKPRRGWRTVSYTHLTLPTIYSV